MEASVGGSNAGLFMLPKQAAGLDLRASPAGAALSGVSSFAFQGTNAHVLLCGAAVTEREHARTGLPCWQRQLVSVLPVAHAQVQCAAAEPGGTRLKLEMQLGQHAVHAFICDHQVSGKPIFPGERVATAAWHGSGALLEDTGGQAAPRFTPPCCNLRQVLGTWRWPSPQCSACCLAGRLAARS